MVKPCGVATWVVSTCMGYGCVALSHPLVPDHLAWLSLHLQVYRHLDFLMPVVRSCRSAAYFLKRVPDVAFQVAGSRACTGHVVRAGPRCSTLILR